MTWQRAERTVELHGTCKCCGFTMSAIEVPHFLPPIDTVLGGRELHGILDPQSSEFGRSGPGKPLEKSSKPLTKPSQR